MKKILSTVCLSLLLSIPVQAREECPADKPVMWIDNACHTCDEAKELLANAPTKGEGLEGLIIMGAMLVYGEACSSADECPADKPAKWTDGQCYACAEIESKVNELKQNGQQPDLSLFSMLMEIGTACPEFVEVNID